MSSKRGAILRILALLVAGALTTWTVAWLAAMLRPTDGWPNLLGHPADQWGGHSMMPQHRQRTQWGDVFVDVVRGPHWTTVNLAPVWTRRIRPADEWLFTTYPYPEDLHSELRARYQGRASFSVPDWATRCEAGTKEINIKTSAWGWPFRALAGTEHIFAQYRPSGTIAATPTTYAGYLCRVGHPDSLRVRRLPVRPVWPGFLIDTALYTSALWLLFLAPGQVRRAIRRRHALCMRCGYDLRGLPTGSPCPECGASPVASAPSQGVEQEESADAGPLAT